MLDMLLTADAARKHGHDESTSTPHDAPTVANHASMLVQMPLSIVGSFLRRQTPSPSPSATATPSGYQVEANAPDAATTTTPQKHITTATGDASVDTPALSRPVSSSSSTATNDRPKKRTPRSKTSYLYARPPRPIDSRSKLHIRPKVLLQLHQVIPSQRPKPTYEVVPFSLLPPRSTRRLARTFNTRDRLGPNDLLIVKAEDYANKDEEAKSEDDSWGSRDVIGVICPAKSERESTEICMDDGFSRWEVTNMSNGGLEFNTVNDHGLTLKARWVPKPAHSRRVSGMSTSSQVLSAFPTGQDDKKYTFSTISPASRRHPIIATMTQSRIDVMDSYTMPSATSPSTPGLSAPHSPSVTPSDIGMDSFMDKLGEQLPIQTDDALRRFIVVSGVCVARQDYYSTSSSGPAVDTRSCNGRTVSMPFVDSPRSASPASTLDENRRSFPKMLRPGTERLPRCMSFTEASPSPSSTRSPNVSPGLRTRSRRANSTGNANLRSMSGSMRKRYGLAFGGETLPETEEERQEKRSAELLRIKELALPSGLDHTPEAPPSTTHTQPVSAIPRPIVIPPSSDGPKSPVLHLSPRPMSPALPDPERTRKTQSAYNPVVTAGMWDSGVSERPGLMSRPTSMFVVNEKKRKQEKKRERSRNKEDNDKGVPTKKNDWHRLKISLKGLFRREKI